MKKHTLQFFKFTTLPVLMVLLVAFFAVTLTAHAARPAGQSNITKGKNGIVFYSPKRLTCTLVSGLCSITIKDGTVTAQSITLNGVVVYTLTPKQVQPISYTLSGTYVYGVSSNPNATLTVTVV